MLETWGDFFCLIEIAIEESEAWNAEEKVSEWEGDFERACHLS